MGKAQAWQRKRGDDVRGPLAVAQAMLAGILEELPKCCLLHRRLALQAPARTLALLERLRIVRDELAKLDLLADDIREQQRILAGARRAYKRQRKGVTQ